jgi:hypothetical protein
MPHPVPADIRYHISMALTDAAKDHPEGVPVWIERAIKQGFANALAEKDRESGQAGNLEPLR